MHGIKAGVAAGIGRAAGVRTYALSTRTLQKAASHDLRTQPNFRAIQIPCKVPEMSHRRSLDAGDVAHAEEAKTSPGIEEKRYSIPKVVEMACYSEKR